MIVIVRKYHEHQVTETDGIYSHPITTIHKTAFGRAEHEKELQKYEGDMDAISEARKAAKTDEGNVSKRGKKLKIAAPSSLIVLMLIMTALPGTYVTGWDGLPLADIWCGDECVIEYAYCSEYYSIEVSGMPGFFFYGGLAEIDRIEDMDGNPIENGFVVLPGQCSYQRAFISKDEWDSVRMYLAASGRHGYMELWSKVIRPASISKATGDGIHRNVVLYDGIVPEFAEKQESLMDYFSITKDTDIRWPVEIFDMNYTSMTIDLYANDEYVPIRFGLRNGSTINYTLSHLDGFLQKTLFLGDIGNFTLLDIHNISFGYASTTVKLDDTATEVLADMATRSISGFYNYDSRTFVKFNLSAAGVPAGNNATDALFCMTAYTLNANWDHGVDYYWADDQTWSEASSTAQLEAVWDNDRSTEGTDLSAWASTGQDCLNVTDQVNMELDNGGTYFSLIITDSEDADRSATDSSDDPLWIGVTYYWFGAPKDSADFRAREYATASARPFLNITFEEILDISLNITDPTDSDTESVSTNDNFTATMWILSDGSNVTSGVTWTNASIGDIEASILTNDDSCSGSASACNTYSSSGDCENCGCSWSGNEDSTDHACGNDCSGGDYSYSGTDTCTDYILGPACAGASSCDGTDTVVDIWLNATNYTSSQTVGITMGVFCYGSTDDVMIWYYNGASWNNEFASTNCNGNGQGYWNITDSVTITGSTGTHYIRGIVGYDGPFSDDHCYTGTYGDNDDIEFEVVSGGTCSGTPDSCAVGTCNATCGCSYTAESPQFAWVAGAGWQANITAPSHDSGLQNLTIYVEYDGANYTDFMDACLDYGSSGTSCDCTSLQAGNPINCSECNITEDCAVGTFLNFTETGTTYLFANLTEVHNITGEPGCILRADAGAGNITSK